MRNAQGVEGTLLELVVSWIPLKVGKTKICHAFYVSYDIKYDLMLGADFLNTNKAVVSFDVNVLYIRNEKLKFCEQYNLTPSVQVISKHTVELPPLAQTMIQTEILNNEGLPSSQNNTGIIEPDRRISIKKEVFGAKTLVSLKGPTVPMIFVDLIEKPVTIYKNTNLGQITPISEQTPITSLEKEHEEDSFMSFATEKHDKKKEKPNVNLTKEQKARLKELTMSYRDVFAN